MAKLDVCLGILCILVCSIGYGEAGNTGLFLEPGVKCVRNSKYTRTTYGCYAYSETPVTWEFARDRCRDDGGHLAIFNHADDYKSTQMRLPPSMLKASNFSYVGVNEDGAFNVTIEPESVPYGVFNTYDEKQSVLSETDLYRPSYQCGVLTHSDWSALQAQPSNVVYDENTGLRWPYKPSPYLNYCPINANDYPQHPFICRFPGPPDGSTCVCTKWKEPGVRTFQGEYMSLPDQTEYVMVEKKGVYEISILLWRNNPPSFPKNDTYIPDNWAPVNVVRVVFGGKVYDMTTRNGSVVMLINGVVTASLTTGYSTTGLTVKTISSKVGWKTMAMILQDGTRIMYDGKNVEIMTVNGIGDQLQRGLCGSCHKNPSGNPLPNGRFTSRKTLLVASWTNPRVRWISLTPAVESCPSETSKRFASTRCRPLFDTTGYFGSCLASNAPVAAKAYASYRQCVAAVCSSGPAAACSFFLDLNNWCGNMAKEYSIKLDCSDNSSCPANKPYTLSTNGICYHVSESVSYWDQAYRYCHSIGAQLASFRDADENEFLQCKIADELMQNITEPEKQFIWIGGIVDDHNQRHWTDGTSMSYLNWDLDQDLTDPAVRCGTYGLESGKWMAKSCKNDTFRALCYVYSITNNTCSGLPCPPPKACIDGACILAPMKVSNCDPNPCQNDGKCFTHGYTGGGFLCVCVQGFFGSRCERSANGTSTKLIPHLDPYMINRLAKPPARRWPPSACWINGNRSDYLLSRDKLAWELAREKCRGYGGRLNSLDLEDDKNAFDASFQPVYSAYLKRSSPLAYLRDGYEYSSKFDCKMWGTESGGACLPDDGNVTCSTATSNGAASPEICPTSAKDGQMPYMCKRHAYTCLCSKWFEPTFRTFNGEDIPVENNAAYTLYSSPTGEYTIAGVLLKGTIVAIDDDDRFTNGEYYAPDKWPIVNRIILTFGSPKQSNQTICELYTSGGIMNEDDGASPEFNIQSECYPSIPDGVKLGIVVADQKASPLITTIVRVDALEKYGFELVYDGSNMELSVKLSNAGTSKPGNGLCGTCDDQLRDLIFSESQIEVENKFVVARSWILGEENWPSSSRRVPTCTTDTLLNAAVRLCYPIHSFYWNMSSPPTESKVNSLYRSCLEQVCQYGPAGACQAFAFFNSKPAFCDTGSRCKNSVADKLYGISKSGNYCEYTRDGLLSKADFYTADASVCQSRGYNLAVMNPDDFSTDNSSSYWAGAVVDVNNKIPFLLSGTDAIRDESKYSDSLDSEPVCVSMNATGEWKNDVECNQLNKFICASPSGSCGGNYCNPPQVCNGQGSCASPTTVTWAS